MGGFRIVRAVGPVPGGVLFEAEQVERERRATLKLIAPTLATSPRFPARFDREQAIATAFYHPHLLTTYEAGEAEGVLYVAARAVTGARLDAVLAQEGRLGYSRAMELISQVAAALDEAHGRGLVHRGLHPGSIIMSRERTEHLYLTDFKMTDETSAYGGLLGAPDRTVPPDPDFAAPEQIRGARSTRVPTSTPWAACSSCW